MPRKPKPIVQRAERPGETLHKFLVIGKISRNGPRTHTYPMHSTAAALLRKRNIGVIDPADKGRSLGQLAPFDDHAQHVLSLAFDAQGIITLPEWLDGRLAALVVEYALSVGKPVLELSSRGQLRMLDASELPWWAVELRHDGDGEVVLRKDMP